MKKSILYLALALALCPSAEAMAQRANKKVAKTAATKKADNKKNVEASKSQSSTKISDINVPMFNSMVPSAAKIMFIDSVVVDKEDFLKSLPLNKESGSLAYYNDFFKADRENNTTVFQNEFGNRVYFAEGDSSITNIYAIDKLGDSWSTPKKVKEISDGFDLPNYPFLSSDGVTLFFGAKGAKSMGGYDIFMTRYNTDDASWYAPENYGLPYNSTANDYLLAIDDFDQLGWLVTDRRQPEDKVCIYTFVPTYPRQNFESDDLTDKQLNSFARILSIEDTWKFGNRDAAMARLEKMLARNSKSSSNSHQFTFVINDNNIYHSLQDFKSPSSREDFQRLQEIQKQHAQNISDLDQLRAKYAAGDSYQRNGLKSQILGLEHQVEAEIREIKQLEKSIRHTENLVLNS